MDNKFRAQANFGVITDLVVPAIIDNPVLFLEMISIESYSKRLIGKREIRYVDLDIELNDSSANALNSSTIWRL